MEIFKADFFLNYDFSVSSTFSFLLRKPGWKQAMYA